MISLNNVQSITEAEEKPTRTYRLDIDKGRIVGYVDGIEAIQQYIRKAIISPRFKCLAYSPQYGSEVDAVCVANRWDKNIIKKLLPSLIKDSLTDSRITDVYNFSFEDGTDSIYVNFNVDTVYGTTEISEVINIV